MRRNSAESCVPFLAQSLAGQALLEVLPHHWIKACLSFKVARRSRAALTYAEAQSRIDDDRLQDEISVNLRRMNAVARLLCAQRAERGALQLASPEVKFEIDSETHDPLDVGMYQVLALPCHTRSVHCPASLSQHRAIGLQTHCMVVVPALVVKLPDSHVYALWP